MYNITINNLAVINYSNKKKILTLKFLHNDLTPENSRKIYSVIKQIVKNESLYFIIDLNKKVQYNKKFRADFLELILTMNIEHIIIIGKNFLSNPFLLQQLKNSNKITVVKTLEEAIKLANSLSFKQELG